MGQVLHGCATTTEAVRRAIHDSQESLRALAKRYGINQKTVAERAAAAALIDEVLLVIPGNREAGILPDRRRDYRAPATPAP